MKKANDARWNILEWWRVVVDDRVQRLDGRGAVEGCGAGEHLVHDDAERKEIGAMVDGLGPNLLRRHVADRSYDHACVSQIPSLGLVLFLLTGFLECDELRQPEIEELHPAVRKDEDVLRLQIAVDDSFVMRGGEAAGNLDGITDGSLEAGAGGQRIAQSFPLEQLGHQKGRAVV